MPELTPPLDLTVPLAGSTTARDVLSSAVGRLLAELLPTIRAHGVGDPDAALVVKTLAAMRDPGALTSVLRRPHVGALVRTLRARPVGEGRALLVELLATLTGDLAHLGAITPLRLRNRPPRIVSPLTQPGNYRSIDGNIRLALLDNNPLAMHEAHPEKQGNAVDLGGRPIEEWVASLHAALVLVERHMFDLRREMDLFVQQIVPVGFFTEQHLSASYREAIGTLYLSLHPNAMTMVEALVHEFSHTKLNALFESDDVLENAFEPLYTSPVRPDPRPLHGILLAVHAFVPVACLYERLIEAGEPGLDARFRDVIRINREGTEVLRAHAKATPIGQGLLDELFRWDEHFRAA